MVANPNILFRVYQPIKEDLFIPESVIPKLYGINVEHGLIQTNGQQLPIDGNYMINLIYKVKPKSLTICELQPMVIPLTNLLEPLTEACGIKILFIVMVDLTAHLRRQLYGNLNEKPMIDFK